jgi:hypothetical protein
MRRTALRIGGSLDQGFHERESIFLHIPKAAGSSVSEAVYGHQVGHWRLSDCMAADATATRNYFTFSFVRDPLDRFVSAFHFLAAGGMNKKDVEFASRHIKGCSLDEFAERVYNIPDLLNKVHLQTQASFLISSESSRTIAVDFVGRFENMAQDFAEVANRLGIEPELPVRNTGPKRNCVQASKATRTIVRQVYAEDYALFGY